MPQDAPPPEADEIDVSGLFDGPFYATAYPDVAAAAGGPAAHFRDFGWRERRRPNPWFDTGWYLDGNPDVCASGLNPLLHFIRFGEVEGRRPSPGFDPAWYAEAFRVATCPAPPAEPTGSTCGAARAAMRGRRRSLAQPRSRARSSRADWPPRRSDEGFRSRLAPGVGLEPTTQRLTAACSTN